MPGDDFYPPMTYSTMWLVLGLVILLALLLWAVLIWWQTRPAPPPTPAPEPSPEARLRTLKADYLARIDEIARLASSNELSTRRAHQELSVTVRQFVQEASGVTAPTMTLTELGRSGMPSLEPVTDVVLRLYPAEFGPDSTAGVASAVRAAREVVGRWS